SAGQVRIVRPCLSVSQHWLNQAGTGLVTYMGSVSNSGNGPLDRVVVSNFVSGAFTYVSGPTNLETNGLIVFTNSFMTAASQPETNTLFAWASDELSLLISSSTADPLPLAAILTPKNGAIFTDP